MLEKLTYAIGDGVADVCGRFANGVVPDGAETLIVSVIAAAAFAAGSVPVTSMPCVPIFGNAVVELVELVALAEVASGDADADGAAVATPRY